MAINPNGICTTCFTHFHQSTRTTVLGANQGAIPHTNAQCPHQFAGFVVGGGGQQKPPKQCKFCGGEHSAKICWHNPNAQGGGGGQLVMIGGGGIGAQLVMAGGGAQTFQPRVVQVGGGGAAPVARGGAVVALFANDSQIWFHGVAYPVKTITPKISPNGTIVKEVEFEHPGGMRHKTRLS